MLIPRPHFSAISFSKGDPCDHVSKNKTIPDFNLEEKGKEKIYRKDVVSEAGFDVF